MKKWNYASVLGNWIQQADQAMIRAAARARAVAASTHTPIHIMKDGKIVEILPALDGQLPMPDKLRDAREITVVREESPPDGSQEP